MKSLKSIALLLAGIVGFCWIFEGPDPPPRISVNVEGYAPGQSKIAYTSASLSPGASFEVLGEGEAGSVWSGDVSMASRRDPAFGARVYELDFSGLDESGAYRLSIPGAGITSEPFRITDRPWREAAEKALRSFRFQRCGTTVGKGTPWSHTACHLDDAVLYGNPGRHRNVTGGWHDAGDYGKFSVTTAVSTAFLLYLGEHTEGHGLFEEGDDRMADGGGAPDLLNEVRYALQWLLRMQRSSDGGVWHKVQKKKWTDEYLPRNDPDRRYLFGVTSTATADFAAVAALAARSFAAVDPAFSDTLARAARRAWDFLSKHPDNLPEGGFSNPDGVQSGEYGDADDGDERLWAAVELYRLTDRERYHDYVLNHADVCGFEPPPVGWKYVGEFACTSYLALPRDRRQPSASDRMRRELEKYADRLVRRAAGNAYGLVLEEDEFYWGSNSVALGYAWTLVRAHEITGRKRYREAARDQLHYVMGRNPFATSFVTGLDGRSVRHPYHQLSMVSSPERPVPGMLVGGPNSRYRPDGQPLSEYAGRAWEDRRKSYQVNETAINYTAPFVYLAGWFTFVSHGAGAAPPGPG